MASISSRITITVPPIASSSSIIIDSSVFFLIAAREFFAWPVAFFPECFQEMGHHVVALVHPLAADMYHVEVQAVVVRVGLQLVCL